LDRQVAVLSAGGIEMSEKSVKESATIEVPLDLALYLTRPDELEKLKRYVTYYFTKHPITERKDDKAQDTRSA
jgi:hypothetical protein